MCARDPAEGAAEDGSQHPRADDMHTRGLRRPRLLTERAQLEPPRGAVHGPPEGGGKQDRGVGGGRLREERAADDRDLGEQRNAQRLEGGECERGPGRAEAGFVSGRGEAEPTHGHGGAGDDLIGSEAEREEREHRGGQRARDQRHRELSGGPPGERSLRGAKRPRDDRSLEPDVDDPAPFGDGLAERRERERYPEPHPRLQKRREQLAHGSAGEGVRRAPARRSPPRGPRRHGARRARSRARSGSRALRPRGPRQPAPRSCAAWRPHHLRARRRARRPRPRRAGAGARAARPRSRYSRAPATDPRRAHRSPPRPRPRRRARRARRRPGRVPNRSGATRMRPAIHAAAGEAPTARTRKPITVRVSTHQSATASATARGNPQCSRVPSQRGSSRAVSATGALCGKTRRASWRGPRTAQDTRWSATKLSTSVVITSPTPRRVRRSAGSAAQSAPPSAAAPSASGRWIHPGSPADARPTAVPSSVPA